MLKGDHGQIHSLAIRNTQQKDTSHRVKQRRRKKNNNKIIISKIYDTVKFEFTQLHVNC